MKLTCLQENLNAGLQITGHLVNKNINLPILNNVLMEVKNEKLKLSSTNLEIGITCSVRCKSETEGSFTVEGKLLSEYVNLLSNDQVDLELEKNDFLSIACKSSQTKIKGIDATDFPVIPQLEKNEPYKINIAEFKKAISQVVFSVAVSESRPEISGVFLSFNKVQKGKVVLVGTDSYRLAEKKAAISDNEKENEVIVPLKTLQEVLRILNNIKDQANAVETMEVHLSDNQILFCMDSVELISRLVDGNYPDYTQIIPSASKTTVIASTSELQKQIKRVALFSKAGIFDINLVFDPAKGLILKATNTQVGESTSELDVEFTGDSNDTVLNYRYLLEGLNNIDSDEVKISLVDGNVPCLIQPKENDDYLYIVMPIKQ
ncbi:DNA polymerase III subunit beta [Candidatus Falkowbacteria bacterium]|jgi:DNA polymerase III subunit beta|nr:DNA polymerase III subunit beta [Candidatus Falkowbacteria bacterium]